jgi:hypothetical protein
MPKGRIVRAETLPALERQCRSIVEAAAERSGPGVVRAAEPMPVGGFLGEFRDEAEEVRLAQMEAVNRFIDFAFQDGPEPAQVMRNFFAIVHGVRPQALYSMSCDEIGLLLGRTAAAHSWRVQRIFSRMLQDSGAGGFKAAFQKTESARRAYSVAQKNNQNRKHKKAA